MLGSILYKNKKIEKDKSIRSVEMYVGYFNHTWDTVFIDIPLSTPSHKVEQVAIDMASQKLYNNPNTLDEVAFVGIYNIPEIEEE